MRILPVIWLSALSILLARGAETKTPAQWAKAIGNDDPAVRQRALEELAKQGGEAEAILQALSQHADPWVAGRAKRLTYDLRGIDRRLPVQLQEEVFGYQELDAQKKAGLLTDLAQRGVGHLSTLAHLHHRLEEDGKITAAEKEQWHQALKTCASINRAELGEMDVEQLNAATLGAIFSGSQNAPTKEAAELYQQWRKLRPSLGKHLSGQAVALEINHLIEDDKTEALLAYLPHIEDPGDRQTALRPVIRKLMKWQPAEPQKTSEPVAIGHLMLLMAMSNDRGALQWYETYLGIHKELPRNLPADMQELEILRLLSKSHVGEAIHLALSLEPDEPRQDILDYQLLRKFSEAMGEKPGNLAQGLPAVKDQSALPRMGRILSSWFPMSRPSRGYPSVEEKVACFDQWAKHDEWLEAAAHYGPKPLYHLVMLKRGKLPEAVRTHEFSGNSDALKSLGSLILYRDGIAGGIPHQQCSVETLRMILEGAMSTSTMNSNSLAPLLELASNWETLHPDLLAVDSFKHQPLYQAALAGRKQGPEKAAALLLEYTQPITVVYEHGNVPPREQPNPLGSVATLLLADLIAAHPDVDATKLLPAEKTSEQALKLMLQRFNRAEDQSLGQVKGALSIAALLRNRFKLDDAIPLIRNHDARAFALKAWMRGDDELASSFLTEAFLSNPDKEEHYDAAFAHALALLGDAEKALAILDRMKEGVGLDEAVRKAKRARLLHVMGRKKAAVEAMTPEHHSKLSLQLALEAEDWKAAFASLRGLDVDPERRSAISAAITALTMEKELHQRQVAEAHPVLALLYGRAVRDEDLENMARDAELSARNEALLTQALATGKPVEAMVLAEYLHHLDLLPNRERAIRIAAGLGKQDNCTIFGRDPGPDNASRHKVIAAEALLLLGEGHQAFEVMRSVMETSEPPHKFKPITGGQMIVVVWGYERATRLAALEWPNEKPEKRIEKLAAILGQKDAKARAEGMVALISKHQEAFNGEDLAKALCLPMMDLANAGGVPEELKNAALTMLRDKKPEKRFMALFERASKPHPWQLETPHRPTQRNQNITASIKPKPGAKSDPRKPDFAIIDGLFKVSAHHKQKEPEKAEALIRDMLIRLLLDPNLYGQESEWVVERQTSSMNYSARSDARGFQTVLRYFAMKDLPPTMTSRFVAACVEPWTNFSDAERLLQGARVCEKAGELDQALTHHRLYLINTMPTMKSRDIGLAGREEIVEMQRVHARIAVAKGNKELARTSILRLLALAPYESEHAAEFSKTVKKEWDENELKKLRDGIDGFWKARLLEIPESKTYQYWRKQWLDAFN